MGGVCSSHGLSPLALGLFLIPWHACWKLVNLALWVFCGLLASRAIRSMLPPCVEGVSALWGYHCGVSWLSGVLSGYPWAVHWVHSGVCIEVSSFYFSA